MTKENIGFVGVGLMGHGMAKNIVEKGHALSVTAHRSRAAIDDLVSRGATERANLADVARASDIIFLCLTDAQAVEAAVAGLRPGLSAGKVIVDCSTNDPGTTVKLAAEMAQLGVDYADAPLGGTPAQALEGQLHAMVGAAPEVFARILPVLETWAAKVAHIGEVASGHRMKLLNNFLSLGYGAIYAEALALSRKVGISIEEFDKVIRGSRMDCGFYQTFMGCALEGRRDAHKFTLANAYKDLRYLESMSNGATCPSPMASAVKNSFAQVVASGLGGPEDYVPHLADFVARTSGLPEAG
ncbi:MAG: NAD(P)-dependent oxidoreductase [Paracoccaceae bacterium]|nr:NAD(P)-dependent oxidoreductase [Paracoccaceae bacterium]